MTFHSIVAYDVPSLYNPRKQVLLCTINKAERSTEFSVKALNLWRIQ